jgi:prefoldin beta subunit
MDCTQEFDALEEDANIYKLVGPVLMKQEKEEAKLNVKKRLEYITGDMWVDRC